MASDTTTRGPAGLGDPQKLLEQMLGSSPPETVDEMRRMIDGFAGFMNAGLPEIGAVHDGVVVRELEGGRVTADVMVPAGEGPHPVLVYLHGGGWICGSPRTHRKLGFRFAEAGYLVINVDYRLAPEAPFPAPFEDCAFAVRWAAAEAARFGGDADRLAIAGDSAGGNLSAAVASAFAADPSAPNIAAALLIYGVFDFGALDVVAEGAASAAGPLGGAAQQLVSLMMDSYLGLERRADLVVDPRVSPIHAASSLPPSHVVVGTADPLLQQAASLVEVFARAGVDHEYNVVDNMPHGFVQMEFFPQAREAIDRMVAFLDRHLR